MYSLSNECRLLLIYNVEKVTTYILRKIADRGAVNVNNICNKIWRIDGSIFDLQECRFLKFNFWNCLRYRSRLSLILYILSEIHRMLLTNGTCTIRELYYKNVKLGRNQRNINAALIDICSLFHTIPWNFGIFASGKGLITGPLKMYLKNGDIIDCNVNHEMVLLPKIMNAVDYMETTASLVVVVEKDTIFQKIIAEMCMDGNALNMILITGKGFPDLCTRVLVHRLSVESSLPVYILVDADPFGISIMLIYRTGSKTMNQFSEQLVCPDMKWLGVHPSELDVVGIPTLPLTTVDHKKIKDIQKCNMPNAVKEELILLQKLGRKSYIDDLSSQFLFNDYIRNKIKRNLTL